MSEVVIFALATGIFLGSHSYTVRQWRMESIEGSPQVVEVRPAYIPAQRIAVRVGDELPPGSVLLTNSVGQYQVAGKGSKVLRGNGPMTRAQAIDHAWWFYAYENRDHAGHAWHLEQQPEVRP